MRLQREQQASRGAPVMMSEAMSETYTPGMSPSSQALSASSPVFSTISDIFTASPSS